jgi:guanylate kinase
MLAGPSCVGKGPLFAALRRFYPDLAGNLKQIVLYNSRAPRPGEEDGVDYHFRTREQIESLATQPGFAVADVRGDLQALEVSTIQAILDAGHDAFFEGNPFIPAKLRGAPELAGIPMLTAFLSPLSRDELEYLTAPERRVDLADLVTDVMRRKLLRRTKRQKTNLSLKDLENIEKRAASALVELQEAWKFDHVLPNHDGEDSENWDAFYYPIGDARKALLAFVAVLRGDEPVGVEKWERELLEARCVH